MGSDGGSPSGRTGGVSPGAGYAAGERDIPGRIPVAGPVTYAWRC